MKQLRPVSLVGAKPTGSPWPWAHTDPHPFAGDADPLRVRTPQNKGAKTQMKQQGLRTVQRLARRTRRLTARLLSVSRVVRQEAFQMFTFQTLSTCDTSLPQHLHVTPGHRTPRAPNARFKPAREPDVSSQKKSMPRGRKLSAFEGTSVIDACGASTHAGNASSVETLREDAWMHDAARQSLPRGNEFGGARHMTVSA